MSHTTSLEPQRNGTEQSFTPSERWTAVATRDRRWDGRFVYAVKTTGIYCRPSCASRRPRRENVRFFAASSDAEAAGFRPCHRCRPRGEASGAEIAIGKAREYLEARIETRVTLEELADAVGMSPHHLQRTFKRLTGVSPRQYTAALRADRLKTVLKSGVTVSRATYEAGYGASSRAYDAAGSHLGMTPGAYRRGGAGVRIHYATARTQLGHVLVAVTERGLCAITLGDGDAQLERVLAEEYPSADLERVALKLPASDQSLLCEWLGAVVHYMNGERSALQLPLDAAGTPFQRRVWEALREIPYGETRSYSQVAQRIGAPQAVRAVASACARNRVAIVIPCHRVVRKDGALGGYRWGPDRKRALLAQEAKT